MSKKEQKKSPKPPGPLPGAADRPVRPGSALYRLMELVARAVAASPAKDAGSGGGGRPPKGRAAK